MPKPQYIQKFRDKWLNDPLLQNWLTTAESTAGKQAKCKVCFTLLSNKLSDLKNHADTKKHKLNCNTILSKAQPKIPFVKEINLEESKIAECRLALYIACHGAISNVDHLVPLCKRTFKGNYISL